VTAARHALELDDTLAEAHATLALVGVNQNPDWKASEPEFQRALELNPNYAMAHLWFAFYLFFSERRDEALAQVELARQLDPLSAVINADQGHFLYATHHYAEARARLRQAMELAPDFGQPHTTLALIELESGHTADALQEARTGLALDPENSRTLGEAGYVLAVAGQSLEAEKLLATLNGLSHQGTAFASYTAMVQVGLGQRDQALDTLQEMAQSRVGAGLHGLGQWHAFDDLSTDPRYQKLLAQAQ
jgi:Tfp pilus assembly protein PilF